MKSFFLILITSLCFVFLSCQKFPKERVLRVGMDLSYPPFETIDEHGNPAGISVDLAKALSEYLHQPLEIENIPFIGLLPSLQTGKIDLIISSMSDTPERRQGIAFSDPYLTIGLGLLTTATSSIHAIQDMDCSGVTIAVRQGTTGQLWAQKNLKQATTVVFDKESTAVLEVLQKKVDGFLYDEMSVWKYHQEHPAETRALLAPLQKESWAIGLRLSDEELRTKINNFLKFFRAEKGFERLGDHYLRDQKEAFAKEGIPFYF